MSKKLEGKIALVTGGSRGIGEMIDCPLPLHPARERSGVAEQDQLCAAACQRGRQGGGAVAEADGGGVLLFSDLRSKSWRSRRRSWARSCSISCWASLQRATAFAMITLGIGELVATAALMFHHFFGGEGGVTTNRMIDQSLFGLSYASGIQVYYLILAWAFIAALLMRLQTMTPLGRMANACRDNFERAQFGLPDGAFVFCCFNNAYKFNPRSFASQMRILKAVDGSVLCTRDTAALTIWSVVAMLTFQLKNRSISAEPRLVTDRTSSRPGTWRIASSSGRVIDTDICSIGMTPLSTPMMMSGKFVVGKTATASVNAW